MAAPVRKVKFPRCRLFESVSDHDAWRTPPRHAALPRSTFACTGTRRRRRRTRKVRTTLGRTVAVTLAAGTVVAIAACSPPEKKDDAAAAGGTAATATSAADLGGMDALIAAA